MLKNPLHVLVLACVVIAAVVVLAVTGVIAAPAAVELLLKIISIVLGGAVIAMAVLKR